MATEARTLWRWLPVVVLGVALVLTAGAVGLAEKRESSALHALLENEARSLVFILERQLETNVHMLRGVNGLFDSTDRVTPAEFQRYVNALRLRSDFQGVQGIGFAELIGDGQVTRHMQDQHGSGRVGYRLFPEGARETLTAITMIEPADWRNQRAIGFDMFSEPVRRAAMLRAWDTGLAAMSGSVTLVQETSTDRQTGFLLYVPVFAKGVFPQTEHDRKMLLRGWAFSPYRMRDFVVSLFQTDAPEHLHLLHVRIDDDQLPPGEGLMFEHVGSGQTTGPRIQIPLNFAGHRWQLSISETMQWRDLHKSATPRLVAVSGLLGSVGFAFASMLLVRAHRRLGQSLAALELTRERSAESEGMMLALFEATTAAIFVIDYEGLIQRCNPAAERIFGYAAAELEGRQFFDLAVDADREAAQNRFNSALRRGVAEVRGERLYQRRDGTQFWAWLSGQRLAGARRQIVLVISDIDDLKRAELECKLSYEALEASRDAVVVTNAANEIIRVNPAYERITGYSAAEVLGRNPRLLQSGKMSADFYRDMWQSLLSNDGWEGELWNRRKDGEIFSESLAISVLRGPDGAISNFIGVFRDTTARRAAEERVRQLAHYDQLTGLPNRTFFLDRMHHALNVANRYARKLGVLFIDLDRFKPINDTLGHDAGDFVLKEVASRLQGAIRESDTPCRQGGDELLVLVPEMLDAGQLIELAEKLCKLIEAPIDFKGKSIGISASICIAMFPTHGMTVDQLIQAADSAMYRAKAEPMRRIHLAEPAPE